MAFSVVVRVIQGRDLLPCDWDGKSDPYCEVSCNSHHEKNRPPRKTSVQSSTLHPRWDETFSFPVSSPETVSVTIHVWDYDWGRTDDKMGFVEIPIKGIKKGEEKVDWYNLSEKGQLEVGVTLIGFGTELEEEVDVVVVESSVPGHKISKKKAALIKDLFKRCDIDGDGHVTKEELAEQLKDMEVCAILAQEGIPVSRAFETFDIDGDGKVTLEEMEKVMTHHSINVPYWAKGSVEEVVKLWSNPKYLTEGQQPLLEGQLQNLAIVRKAVILDYKKFLLDNAIDLRTEPRHQIFDEATTALLHEFNIDPAKINGNSRSWWGTPEQGLFKYAKQTVATISGALNYSPNAHQQKVAIHTLIGFLVRMNYEIRLDDNIGAIKLNLDPPVLLFRSGTMVNCGDENSCLRNLIKHANLRHIINLYAGHYPLHDVYVTEKRLIEEAGGTYHNENFVEPPRLYKEIIDNDADYQKNFDEAVAVVKSIVKEVLRPHGEKPKGNILIHCGGGMHRTGIIFGTIARVINNLPIEVIERDYWYHTGEDIPKNVKGGGSPLNVNFVKDFPAHTLNELLDVEEHRTAQEGDFDQWGYVKGTPAIQFPELAK